MVQSQSTFALLKVKLQFQAKILKPWEFSNILKYTLLLNQYTLFISALLEF